MRLVRAAITNLKTTVMIITYETKRRFLKMLEEHKIYIIHRGITRSGLVNFSVRGFELGLEWCFDPLVSETVEVKRVKDYMGNLLLRSKDPTNVLCMVVNRLAKDGLCEKTDYFRVRELAHFV